MKFLSILLISSLFFGACGNQNEPVQKNRGIYKASSQVTGEAANPGLFEIKESAVNDPDTLLGIWETPLHKNKDGHRNKMRFRFDLNEVEITKLCMYTTGVVSFSTTTHSGRYVNGEFIQYTSGQHIEYFQIGEQRYGCVSGLEATYNFSESNIDQGVFRPGTPYQFKKISDLY